MTSWHIALREIVRNPFRVLLMSVGVAVAACAMTAVALIVVGVNHGIQQTVGRLGADLMVVPEGEGVARQFNEALIAGKPAAFYLDPAVLQSVSRVPGVAAVSGQTFVVSLTNARCCSGMFFLIGFDPETDFTVSPWLKDGSLPALPGAQNLMVVGDRILLRKGDEVKFYGTSFSVAGVLEPTGTGMDWTIYIPTAGLRRMIADSEEKAELPLRIAEGAASALFVSALPGTDLIDLAERIEQAQPSVQAILSSSVGSMARRQVSGITTALACLFMAVWVMALALNSVVFSQAIRERQGELGLLLAKGADRRFLLGMLAMESTLVALSASLAGCIAGTLGITWFRELLARSLGAPDVLPAASNTVLIAALLVVLLTLSASAAALAPALRVLRMAPYEAIRKRVMA